MAVFCFPFLFTFIFFFFLETAGLARKTNEQPPFPQGSHHFLPWVVQALVVYE